MSGFSNTSFNNQVAIGILNHIFEKMLECFDLMRQDCKRDSMKIANNEVCIRDYLFCNYLNNDAVMRAIGFDDFMFIPEVPENYINNKPIGRADLQVFSSERFHHRERYFIIECKRIDGNLTLDREYIDEGIRRFVGESPKYTSFFKVNGMLGFVVREFDVAQNIDRINQLLKSDYSDIHVQDYLHMGSTPHTYISSHGETVHERITLIHVFPNCVSLLN
jgi:hypothetical protein